MMSTLPVHAHWAECLMGIAIVSVLQVLMKLKRPTLQEEQEESGTIKILLS